MLATSTPRQRIPLDLPIQLTIFEAFVSKVAEPHKEDAKAQNSTAEHYEPNQAGCKQTVHSAASAGVDSHRLAVHRVFS